MQTLRPNHNITKYAEILQPADSEAPILSPDIRMTIRQWMTEIGAEDELKAYGLKPRRSALLSGPPGCGKTTMAHHFAARLGLPLVLVNIGSLISCYLGATGQNINAMFDALQEQHQSCVLFLDEFDSIGTKRTNSGQGVSQERNSIVIALLQKIDAFTGTLIAATNRGDEIDSAIWRRFGMHLEIKEPDDESRYAILTRYLEPLKISEESMNIITEVTAGASPAVLRQLMEGLKRDVVLSPRFEQKQDPVSVFKRVMVSVRPHADAMLPPLWKEQWAMDEIEKIAWPPPDKK